MMEDWDAFTAAHPFGSLLQSSKWAALKASFDWHADRVRLEEGGQLVAGAQLLFKAKWRFLRLAYVPRGPVVDWSDAAAVEALLERVVRRARRRRALRLWIEPRAEDSAELRARLRRLGWRERPKPVQPPRTILVDLTPSEEEILARMKQKTRYNVRLARRKGVIVRTGGMDDVPHFIRLMEETARRDGFAVRPAAYYRRFVALFVPHDAALLLAEVEGEVVAALIVAAWGRTAYYLYGASGARHRNRMPNYLLQWEAMRWARRRGCTQYDLWGIPDADERELEASFRHRSDGLWGVYRFKRGFGGRVVRYAGLWERSPWR